MNDFLSCIFLHLLIRYDTNAGIIATLIEIWWIFTIDHVLTWNHVFANNKNLKQTKLAKGNFVSFRIQGRGNNQTAERTWIWSQRNESYQDILIPESLNFCLIFSYCRPTPSK